MESYGLPPGTVCGDSMAHRGSRIPPGGKRDCKPTRWDSIATEHSGFSPRTRVWKLGGNSSICLADGAKFQKAADHLFAVGFTWDADYTILTTRERAAGELGSGALLNGSLPAYPILKKNSEQVVDRNNGIWFVPRDPFILRHPAGEPLAEIVGKASPDNSQIYDINPYRYARLVARDGSFWMGDSSGLHRFSYTPLIEAPLPKALGTRFTVAPDDAGVVWISNDGGDGTSPLYRVAGDRAEVRGRQGGSALFAYRAPDKTLWFGADGGLVHMVAGRLQEIRLLPEMADKAAGMLSITQDRSGGIWLSLGGNGLYLLKDGTWTKLGGHRELIPGCLIEFTDSVGRVWFGSKANRIEMLDGDRVRVFGPGDGLQVGNVTALSGLGPEIWVGGQLGLEHFEGGRFRAIRSINKEWLRGISGIVERANGDLWLNGLGGIIHLRRAEIVEALKNPAYEVGGERFGRREGQPGLPSQFGTMPTAIEGTDGRLWFTGKHGVVWLDPSHASKRTPPPSVTIESVSADDKGYRLDLPIRFPPHIASVQISYAAVSLSDPEAIRFRYKLRETDTDWHESATSMVSYRNLPPGTYHFVVNASDTNGSRSDNTATSEFIVLPAFYQTNWFRGLGAAAFLGLLWAAYEFRVRQLQREFSMTTEARLNERTRIARDLHDTLLQSVQGLMFSFQAARNLLPDRTDEAIRTLDHAIREGDAAIAEGRDAIQGLRADPALTSDLEDLLTAAGKELARSSTWDGEPPAFRVIVEGGPRSVCPALQDEVYRIAREILRNAFQHAHALRIEAEIAYDPQFFRLRIRDNGKGIDRKVLDQGARPGHWGLPGVRERAKRSGRR